MVSKSKSYYIHDIPGATWQKLRVRAMREGVPIHALFRSWIQNYARGQRLYAHSVADEGELIDAAQEGTVRGRK